MTYSINKPMKTDKNIANKIVLITFLIVGILSIIALNF